MAERLSRQVASEPKRQTRAWEPESRPDPDLDPDLDPQTRSQTRPHDQGVRLRRTGPDPEVRCQSQSRSLLLEQ
jgi:hypothetical protein